MWSHHALLEPSMWSTLLAAPPRRRHLDLAPVAVAGTTDDSFNIDSYFVVDAHHRVQVTLAALAARQREGAGVALPQFSRASGSAQGGAQCSGGGAQGNGGQGNGATTTMLPEDDGTGGLDQCHLLFVAFKLGRLDVFYTTEPGTLAVGDLVMVEADRGRDLGRVAKLAVLIDEARMLKMLQHYQQLQALVDERRNDQAGAPLTFPYPKRVLRPVTAVERAGVAAKARDEDLACRQFLVKLRHTAQLLAPGAPVRQMRLVDAEYQFDRRKLTFYYSLRQRIDFRDLVRELFRFYKTRIWMLAVNGVPYVVPREPEMVMVDEFTETPSEQWYTPRRVGFGSRYDTASGAGYGLGCGTGYALGTGEFSMLPSATMPPLIGGMPSAGTTPMWDDGAGTGAGTAITEVMAEVRSPQVPTPGTSVSATTATTATEEHLRMEPLLALLVNSINLG